MRVLALVSPFAALGLLIVMQGFEGWVLGGSPDAVPPDAIGVAGMTEDDLADRKRPILSGDGIGRPRLSAVVAPADLFGRRAHQTTAARYRDHQRDAA